LTNFQINDIKERVKREAVKIGIRIRVLKEVSKEMVSETLELLASLGMIVILVLVVIGLGIGAGIGVFIETVLDSLPSAKNKRVSR